MAKRCSFKIIQTALIKEDKLYYNIQALKLRKHNGYTLTSRKFADDLRKLFKSLEHKWPNISMKLGPQTLMQGWEQFNLDFPIEEILKIVNRFIEILIENLLINRKGKLNSN